MTNTFVWTIQQRKDPLANYTLTDSIQIQMTTFGLILSQKTPAKKQKVRDIQEVAICEELVSLEL